jgi:hypothetical protein
MFVIALGFLRAPHLPKANGQHQHQGYARQQIDNVEIAHLSSFSDENSAGWQRQAKAPDRLEKGMLRFRFSSTALLSRPLFLSCFVNQTRHTAFTFLVEFAQILWKFPSMRIWGIPLRLSRHGAGNSARRSVARKGCLR